MRMQQEAGESRRKGRTDAWQMMQGNLVAKSCHERAALGVEQNVPSLLQFAAASNGKGSSGENSMSLPFLWVFSSLPDLLVLVSLYSDNLLLLWQRSV